MNLRNLPNLDQSLLSALDFFKDKDLPKLNITLSGLPIIVGSGNAINTGKILFSNKPAIFANESDFLSKLKIYQSLIKNKVIDEAIIISASGEKDATWEIKEAKKNKLKTTLLTCSPNSSAAELADWVIVYKKIAEPQTYNISTYLGMILSKTQEKPYDIEKFIKKLALKKNFNNYKAYAFILPDEFASITPMLNIKRHELFGPNLSLRAFSFGEARHAKFVMPSEKELVISLGKNKFFGLPRHRYEINMPKKYNAGLVMALTYYLIGKIQESKPPYYKRNIAKYCKEGPLAYGKKKPFDIIVD
ncbi:MAG TPA: hypothetical protein VFD51_00970 [Patescibacteria group bacterium]|nr:hypothetical protein [Patescibacteria group bacterium]